MSSIKSAELRMVDEVLRGEGKGYILDFSNRTFAEFFDEEFDFDIYSDQYASEGTSKASRLKGFLKVVDDFTAAKVLQRLYDYRQALLSQMRAVANATGDAQLLTLVQRLKAGSSNSGMVPQQTYRRDVFDSLYLRLRELWQMAPHPRGYAFEAYLKDLFNAFHLNARDPFTLVGEQIDGSFQLGHETYLLEAKWHQNKIGAAELNAFHGKIDQKAAWTRGLFISYVGFTNEGLSAFGRGRKIICLEGKDINDALQYRIHLDLVLEQKVRRAAETGEAFAPVSVLFSISS